MEKDVKCVYDPELARDKSKGPRAIYKPIVPGVASQDPRSRDKYLKYTTRGARAVYAALPVPQLTYDSNWIGRAPDTRLLISGLGPLTTASQIRDALADVGQLDVCDIVPNPVTAASLGLAELRFKGAVAVSHRAARTVISRANAGALRVGMDVIKATFDQNKSILQGKLAEARRVHEDKLREQRRQEATTRRERERAEQRAELEISAEERTARHKRFLADKIGNHPYIFIAERSMPASSSSVSDIRKALREYQISRILQHPYGYYIVFPNYGEAHDCHRNENGRRIGRHRADMTLRVPPKEVLDVKQERTVRPQAGQVKAPIDPVDTATAAIVKELEAAIRKDIYQRIVMPLIFEGIQPSRYPELAKENIALKSEDVAEHGSTVTEAVKPEIRLPSAVSMRKPKVKSESGQNKDALSLPRFKKRTSRLHHISMNDYDDDEKDDDLDKLEAKAEAEDSATRLAKRRRTEHTMYSSSESESEMKSEPESLPTEDLDGDVVMADYAQPSKNTQVMGLRPRPLHEDNIGEENMYLSRFQTLVLDEEDLQFAQEALGHITPAPISNIPAWYARNLEMEQLHQGQDTVTEQIPKEMLDIKWEQPQSSWRSRGYEKIPSIDKISYLSHRRRANKALRGPDEKEPSVPLATNNSSRNMRMSNRRFAQDLNIQKQSLSVETELLNWNQLVKRRKPVRFARSAIHNWGLYAVEPIAQNDMIIEYVGQVIRAPLADLRERNYIRAGIGSSYLFRIDEETVIDATKRGGIARFINHCCTPSCTAKIIKVGGTKRIVIYALRDIQANEELTYDYKFEREEGEDRIPCLCGSSGCKGFLN